MTKQKSTKRALLTSALVLIMCVAMLVGTTFAWFTDSVTSSGNKIQAGTLKMDLLLKDGDDNWTSIKESEKAIFDYDLWEPGYTDVKVLKVVNEGSLALKWMAKFVSDFELTALADVIDVYVNTSAQDMPATRDEVATWNKVGTVREFVNTIQTTTTGELTANESAYLGIALKMQETAGNEYQGMSLGGVFDLQIVATQLTYEKDTFDDQYDVNATYPYVSSKVALSGAATEDTSFNTGKISINVPEELLNDLADDADYIQLKHTKPEVNDNDLVFDVVEFYDENDEIVDLETLGNDKPMTVSLYVGNVFAPGAIVDVFHDDVSVATAITVDAKGYISYTVLHLCEVKVVKNPTINVTTKEDLVSALEDAVAGDIINATGVTLVPTGDVNTTVHIPAGVTLKGATLAPTGNAYLTLGEGADPIVFEDCSFPGVNMSSYVIGTNGCADVTFTNCEFKGQIMPNATTNTAATFTFDNCTFTLSNGSGSIGYVNCMGGTHIFNNCTFDFTGGATFGSNQYVRWNSVHSYSESRYSTNVILNGCTRINCGTSKYGPNSTIAVK